VRPTARIKPVDLAARCACLNAAAFSMAIALMPGRVLPFARTVRVAGEAAVRLT